MPFPALGSSCCSPPPVTTSMGVRPVGLSLGVPGPRPRGLWKGRGSSFPRLATTSAAPSASYDKRRHTPALTADDTASSDGGYDDDDARSDYSNGSRKRRRLGSPDSPPTPEDTTSVLYWDYSRKCSPPNPQRLNKWTTRTKLMDTSATTGPGQPAADRGPNCDLEDWEDLKELFAKAAEMYDTQEPAETIPLLRGVIHECHRFMKFYQDPSVLYATQPLPEKTAHTTTTGPEEKMIRDWMTNERPPLYPPRTSHKAAQTADPIIIAPSDNEKKCKCKDLPTAFHTIFGATLFFFGNLIAQDPSLALPGEPTLPTPYWLTALDVFEIGENLPIRVSGRGCPSAPEDWRMAIVWGRTLTCIADEVLSRQKQQMQEGRGASGPAGQPSSAGSSGSWPSSASSSTFSFLPLPAAAFPSAFPSGMPFPMMPTPASPGSNPGTPDEPAWPSESPFALIVSRRPPVSRPLSLATVTPHELLVLAQDQFSRGIFHMPHPQHHAPGSNRYQRLWGLASASSSTKSSKNSTPLTTPTTTKPHPPPTASSVSSSSTGTTPSTSSSSSAASIPPTAFSRAKELYTIASEVLLISEKLFLPSERAEWAHWADGVFSQMRMEVEVADVDDAWKGLIFAARGRCNLVIGSARAEGVEEAMEKEDAMGGGGVLDSEEAQEAREVLADAVEFLDKARGVLRDRKERERQGKEGKDAKDKDRDGEGNVLMLSADADEDADVELPAEGALEGEYNVVCPSSAHQHQLHAHPEPEDGEEEEDADDRELRTLLAEALLTLANLTQNEAEQDALYARAKKEGVVLDDEDAMDVCG
ncbi:unnamed protein product [Cyclocybe aegerita]|uniref:Uncharacterized protein n=1 Tax=Cyclocybe aegerita TaxID=1973307 RepID=A0A8S0W0E8_CYCAE|nr:unnamed protein product [Cyclocybe aegerita]